MALVALAAAGAATAVVREARARATHVEATHRRIEGIITAVDHVNVTISPIRGRRRCITGRVDNRTRVIIDGHAAHVADLRVTYDARAELGLDDYWKTIRVDTSR